MFCEIPEFGRCCFCMPLRRGVLTFGYLSIIFSLFMIVMYSIAVHNDTGSMFLYHGVIVDVEAKLCIAVYCVDILFNVLMVYGAHRQIVRYLKIFYYYVISTTVASVILELVSMADMRYFPEFDLMCLFFVGLVLHLYVLFLVRSLLQKMEKTESGYENQLHQYVNGDIKIESNGIYPSTVIAVENA